MDTDEQLHTPEHDGSPQQSRSSPNTTNDVATPTAGSAARPTRPPPPKFSPTKLPDRPRPPLRPTAKSLSLPRGMRLVAADAARAKKRAVRRSMDDSGVDPNTRSYNRPFSFPGLDSEEGKVTDMCRRDEQQQPSWFSEGRGQDQLVKEANELVSNRPTKPPDSSDKTSNKDASTVSTAASSPPQVNVKNVVSNSTSSPARKNHTPPTSKPPSRPPRPTQAQLDARVSKKRPPPVLVSPEKKTEEQGGSKARPPVPAITVIDTRSNEVHVSTDDDVARSPTLLLPPSTAVTSPLHPPPPSSPPPILPPPAISSEQNLLATAEPVDTKQNTPSNENTQASGLTPVPKPSPSATATPQTVQTEDGLTEEGAIKTNDTQENEGHEAEKDSLQPLSEQSTSPQSKGKRFLNSMKKSLRLGGGRQRYTAPGRTKTVSSSPKGMRRAYTTRESRSSPISKVYDQKLYPDTLPQGAVSPLVIQCVAYLNREHVLKEEGLFRVPGDLAAMKRFRLRFIAGDEVDLIGDVYDPHTVAGLLKLHFREMRVSLIARGQTMAEAVHAVQSKKVGDFHDIVQSLDLAHVLTLRMLAELLCKISAYSDINHMTSGTLATSCGPSIFPYLPPSNANAIVKFLIDHCNDIFTD